MKHVYRPSKMSYYTQMLQTMLGQLVHTLDSNISKFNSPHNDGVPAIVRPRTLIRRLTIDHNKHCTRNLGTT